MMTRIQVIIADDHPIVRDGLCTILAADPQISVVGMATSFAEVLSLLVTTPTDVLVLDLNGMGGAPLTLVTHVRREYPHVAIIVFSSSIDLAPELLAAGVHGYVVKEDLTSQLLEAIYATQAGQSFVSPAVEEYVTRSTTLRKQQHLTPQELNVLKLLAQGLGTIAIAEQLEINARVVQNYITVLRRKTGCGERTQLADWYRRVYGSAEEETVQRPS